MIEKARAPLRASVLSSLLHPSPCPDTECTEIRHEGGGLLSWGSSTPTPFLCYSYGRREGQQRSVDFSGMWRVVVAGGGCKRRRHIVVPILVMPMRCLYFFFFFPRLSLLLLLSLHVRCGRLLSVCLC